MDTKVIIWRKKSTLFSKNVHFFCQLNYNKVDYNLLRKKIKDKGITIVDLSQKIGLSRTGLTKTFKNKSLTVATLEKLSKELDIPVTFWFEPANQKNMVSEPNDAYLRYDEKSNHIELEINKELVSALKAEITFLRSQVSFLQELINKECELPKTKSNAG